jgi:hypothetical protein
MNNAGLKIMVGGVCRPYGAWLVGGALATKIPLLTELGDGINDLRRFYENDVRDHALDFSSEELTERFAMGCNWKWRSKTFCGGVPF